MINGAHVIILSKQPEADRAFFRDVLGLTHVDVGGGWLIFGLPPAEVAVHPAERDSVHEFYLMCEDVGALAEALAGRGIACSPIEDQGWGLLTSITLPGGGTLGAYEPRHPRPTAKALSGATARTAKDAPKKRASKKSVSKKSASKKSASKKSVSKKSASKKSVSKSSAPQKLAPKKATPKKAAKRAVRSKRR